MQNSRTPATALALPFVALLVLGAAGLSACAGSQNGGSDGPSPGSDDPPPPPPPPPPPTPDRPLQVVLEIDRMQGVPALATDQTIDGRAVSLAAIYADADVELLIDEDDDDLPALDPLTLGDLHGLMVANRDSTLQGDLHVYALMATEQLGRPDTLGIMFDFAENDANDVPREAFAVFADAHDDFGSRKVHELLLTTAHELAHCFNLHHNDWQGQGFKNDATVESYCFTDTVRWSLSDHSKEHLAEHPRRLVLFGQNSLPFSFITQAHSDRHQAVPFHQYEVIDDGDLSRASRRLEFDAAAAARGTRVVEGAARRGPASGGLALSLRAPKPTFDAGEPIVLDAVLRNEGDEPLEVAALLDPAFGFLNLHIQRLDGPEVVPYHPPVHANGRARAALTLEPGRELSAPCKVFFGAGGWLFTEPGTYAVSASYHDVTAEGSRWLEAPALRVTVLDADDASRVAAAQLTLDHQTGLYLYMEGGDHLSKAVSNLRAVAEQHTDTPQAASARWALGMAALRPGLDPATKSRRDVRLDEARHYLDGILDADLPDRSKIRAQSLFAEALDGAGAAEEAESVRMQTVQRYWDGEEELDPETLKRTNLREILEQDQLQRLREKATEQYERVKGN